MPISQAKLDSLWDFSDPAATIDRFREAMDADGVDAEARAELTTQVARAWGLIGNFEEAESELAIALEEVDQPSEHLLARIALERGRLRVAEGKPDEAVPLFTSAARHAAADGSQYLALDALHMLALADNGHQEEWAAEGFSMLGTVTDPRTLRWGVALHNNLAWYLHDSGRPEEAMPHFQQALAAAEEYGTSDQRFIGRWAIGRCLRTLGRLDEARQIQEGLAAERPRDRFVREELDALGVPAATGDDSPGE
jgi:tetratricopeptide (TPR) repeat protein